LTLQTPPESQYPPNSPKKQSLGGLYHGMQFAMTALIGMGIGYWLDKKYVPSPVGTLGGLFVGSALGMYFLARSLK